MALRRKSTEPTAAPAPESASPPRLPPDPTRGDPRVSRLESWLQGGEWPMADSLFATLGSPHEREFFFNRIEDIACDRDVFDAWVHGTGGSPNALLARAAHGRRRSLKLNASTPADQITREHDAVMRGIGREVDADLARVIDLDAEDPVPWYLSVSNGVASGIAMEELTFRFEEADRRCPGLIILHNKFLQAVGFSSSGGPEPMLRFARLVAADAPGGSPLHGLVSLAHVTYFGRVIRFGGDEAERLLYQRDVNVRHEVERAAEMTVFHPRWVDTPLTVHTLNIVACALRAFGFAALGREAAERIGTRVTITPWNLLRGGIEAALDPKATF